MRKFCIAGLQLDLADRDNIDRITSEIAATKQRYPWVDMMVLGELSAYGFNPEYAQAPGGAAEEAFTSAARENEVWLIPGSMFQRVAGRIFNASCVIDPHGAIVARYHKIFPFWPYEAGIEAGDSLCNFTVPGVGGFGLTICYDSWFPELARSLVWLGAEVLINSSVTYTIDRDVELSIARATAATNQCYVFNVNGAGALGRGRSIVCGPGGEVLHEGSATAETFVLELDLDYVSQVRTKGWHGLAQALKSFRDNTVVFPAYQPGARSPVLDALGPLAMRERAKP